MCNERGNTISLISSAEARKLFPFTSEVRYYIISVPFESDATPAPM